MDNKNTVTRILAVDDEPQVLSALKRVFRGGGFAITTAESGKEALTLAKNGEFDILLSDMRMPEMDGATFLAKSMELQPNARRILLTGYSDQESTIRAINEGKIHQYLNKPWDNKTLRDTIASEAVIKHEQVDSSVEEVSQLKTQVSAVTAELATVTSYADLAKEELLNLCATTIKVISGLASQLAPTPDGFTQGVMSHGAAMAKLLKMGPAFVREIRTASLLFQLGKLALPTQLRERSPHELPPNDLSEFNRFGILGADILTPIDSLDFAANIIRHQNENFNGTGPLHVKGKEIPLGSRILRLAVDYHLAIHGLLFKAPLSTVDACEYLMSRAGKTYDPALTQLYTALVKKLSEIHHEAQDHMVHPDDLKEGMIVSRDVSSKEGILLLAKASELTSTIIRKMQSYLESNPQELSVFIKLPDLDEKKEA